MDDLELLRLKQCSSCDDKYLMTSSGFAFTVFLGSVLGLYIGYQSLSGAAGMVAFGAFNAGYAWVAARVVSMAWAYFAPHARRR